MHRWLEIIADNISEWTIDEVKNRSDLIAQLLLAEGVSQTELRNGLEEVLKHLELTLDCSTGQEILSAYDESASELAIEREEDTQVKFYIIDRTFVDAEGTRWIVDYKTSHKDQLSLEDFLVAQKQEYQKQLENYAQLMSALETRPIKLMLYFTLYQRPVIWDWN